MINRREHEKINVKSKTVIIEKDGNYMIKGSIILEDTRVCVCVCVCVCVYPMSENLKI